MTVDISNASLVPRSDYANILRKILAEGHCPFCKEYLSKHHTEPILKEGLHWLVTRNFKPYDGVKNQFLVIALSHVEQIEDLPPGAGDEIVEHFRFLSEQFKFTGATIVWRSGETSMTGASVKHLHFQVIVGVPRGDHTDPLTALVGFKPAP